MMILLEFIKFAYQNMRRSKMRTVLTVLSIVIGICTIVVISALNEGNKKELSEYIDKEGHNLLLLTSYEWQQSQQQHSDNKDPQSLNFEEHKSLNLKKARLIRSMIPEVIKVSPERISTTKINARLKNIKAKGIEAQIIEVAFDYFDIREVSVIKGRSFTKEEINNYDDVCMLAMNKDMFTLWQGGKILDSTLQVDTRTMRVIGITEYKENSFIENNFVVYIPFNSLKKMPNSHFQKVLFRVDKEKNVPKARRLINMAVAMLFPAFRQESITNPLEEFMEEKQMLKQIAMIMGGIAAISLIVGGIGIMNIMLVSVLERKREIGIKKAIGANKYEILGEFILETTLLCLFGGAIGVCLGIILALVASSALELPMSLPLIPAAIGFFFSFLMALLAGLYPSYLAAKLDPIDALGFS